MQDDPPVVPWSEVKRRRGQTRTRVPKRPVGEQYASFDEYHEARHGMPQDDMQTTAHRSYENMKARR